MQFPDLFKIGNNTSGFLREKGDFFKVERTESNRIVATAKQGDNKFSKVIYETGRVVETRSYKM